MSNSPETTNRKSRRRAAATARHEPEVTAPREPVMNIPSRPTSLIRFEQLNEQGGYTFSLGLWGALLADMRPDVSVPVSVVDVLALAVVHLIRTDSKDLQEACKLVRATLQKVHDNLEAGMDVEEVLRVAEESALSSLEEAKAKIAAEQTEEALDPTSDA